MYIEYVNTMPTIMTTTENVLYWQAFCFIARVAVYIELKQYRLPFYIVYYRRYSFM